MSSAHAPAGITQLPLCGTHSKALAPSTEDTAFAEQVYPAAHPLPHFCRQYEAPIEPMYTHSEPVPHWASWVHVAHAGRFPTPVEVTFIE